MGSVFLRGSSWTIEYRQRNGRIKRESVGKRGVITKTLARAILQKRERGVKVGKEGLDDIDIPALGEFSEEYVAYKRDTKKLRSWRSDEQHMRVHLIPFFGSERKLSDIQTQDIDDYKSSRLREGAAPATVTRRYYWASLSRSQAHGRNQND